MNDIENDIFNSKMFEVQSIDFAQDAEAKDAPQLVRDMEVFTHSSVVLREVNPDGTLQHLITPFPIRGMVIQNFSSVNLILSFNDGTSLTIGTGVIFKLIPPSNAQNFRAQTAVSGSGYVSILCYPTYLIPDAINLESANIGPLTSDNIGQVTVGSTAVQIAPSRDTRSGIDIRNMDAAVTLFVGTSNAVTSSNGYPLYPKESKVFGGQTSFWAIAASSIQVAYDDEF